MGQQKINVRTMSKSGSATSLVRVRMANNWCFHVALDERGDVDVFVADPDAVILNLEHKTEAPAAPAFKQFLSHNTRLTLTDKVKILVHEFPFRTAAELASKVNPSFLSPDSLHKRLPDLRKKGIISNPSTRKCAVTGKVAQTWAPKMLVAGVPTNA